jgi:CysZ protein
MDLLNGIKYNLRGLALSLRTPKLLILGLLRFAAVILITIAAASLILAYHQEILNRIWTQPESRWLVWLWEVTSWLLSLILVGVSALLSYIVSQIFFGVFIMDIMSRITEKITTGQIREHSHIPWHQQLFFLVKQEIPRTIVPVLLMLLLVVMGWLTPLGPVVTIVSSAVAVIFLAWDNTDLIPARQLVPFKKRFAMLMRSLLFHLGFGLLFLVPLLNIVFLSFAPVGATLYHIDKNSHLQ